jgi:Listeria-Bacteroides repeat domain (List_Bact_rpt)
MASSRLGSGKALRVDQNVKSPDSRYRLTLQKDGNLVIYDGTTGVWASNTVGKGAIRLEMQASDGNLVLYDAAGKAVWDSNTAGNPGAFAQMQDDGNLVILDGTTHIWETRTAGPSILPSGEFLGVDQNVTSPDLRYRLTLQKDGNLVIYDGTTGVWASNTVGKGAIRLEMQASDGNLVLYDAAGVAVWASNTVGQPGAFAVLRDDGHLVVFEGATARWASGQFTVSYRGNGSDGGIVPPGRPYTFGPQALVDPGTGMTKTGATFAYWNTEPDGSGAYYGWPEPASVFLPAENVTLYAQWYVTTGLTDVGGGPASRSITPSPTTARCKQVGSSRRALRHSEESPTPRTSILCPVGLPGSPPRGRRGFLFMSRPSRLVARGIQVSVFGSCPSATTSTSCGAFSSPRSPRAS